MCSDLEVKVNEDQTEAEVILPGFSFGDLNRFGKLITSTLQLISHLLDSTVLIIIKNC